MTPEERYAYIESLLAAAVKQRDILELSLGQANAIVHYLNDALTVTGLSLSRE